MKIKRIIPALVAALLSLCSCHHIDSWDNDPVGNFEALWTIVDEHYCFFKGKRVDWDEVYSRYRPRIHKEMNSEELFTICAEMLNELRDGHVNLSSGFNTSYYTKWWSDYPQNYNERLVQQYYLNFREKHIGSVTYAMLPENIGYLRYPSFLSDLGHSNINAILADFLTADGLIIDIRDNGGGGLDNVKTLVQHFITKPILAGYISHKTGPKHDDFSEPFAYAYESLGDGNIVWMKPVVVLTNRSCYSAANNFVSIMRYLPGVRIVGDRTGGGCGMPYSSELPNGWGVRFSACVILDRNGNTTEWGIEPSYGCDVDLDPVKALHGHDTMLDFAIRKLSGK